MNTDQTIQRGVAPEARAGRRCRLCWGTNERPNSTVMLYRHNSLPWIAPLVLQYERVTGDRYIIASVVTAGREVDSNRTAGDFVIADGTTYEVEHKGTVTLMPGFKVEQGATFSVKLSDY